MLLKEIACDSDERAATWTTSPDYRSSNFDITLSRFEEVTLLLLERPNLNSSNLFRADILFDSLAELKTVSEQEAHHGIYNPQSQLTAGERQSNRHAPPAFEGFVLERTVIRRLIPRNPQLDRPLEQSCFIFSSSDPEPGRGQKQVVVYTPHVLDEHDMPWYHPRVSALAYLFESRDTGAVVSIHAKPFDTNNEETSTRLHRTLLSLLRIFIRLTKLGKPPETCRDAASKPVASLSTAPSALKDTILPQHLVQDTYTRLKQTYVHDLIARWVEKTEPSKHVFEDLSIAAFLIELWKQMYRNEAFPGFVDLACGNGVLVYVLIQEGYHGYGLDARSRKSWDTLGIHEHLQQRLCVPQPFLDAARARGNPLVGPLHCGLFPSGTFIISNHADELTPWTPLLATLSDLKSPLPFLAIPCCSHRLSGARHRYSIKDINSSSSAASPVYLSSDDAKDGAQDAHGDLRALRAQKLQAATHVSDKSQYSLLTKKVVALAQEIGHEVEMTLMRIPSTRNIGIVGNRKKVAIGQRMDHSTAGEAEEMASTMLGQIQRLLDRECARDGGIDAAAEIWIEQGKKLQENTGRGKVNLGGRPTGMGECPSSSESDSQAIAVRTMEPTLQ